MRPSECGFATPPPEDSRDDEQVRMFADFLTLYATEGAPAIRARVHADPDFREFVFGSRTIHGPAF